MCDLRPRIGGYLNPQKIASVLGRFDVKSPNRRYDCL